jgi:hypothetical protein
MTKRGNEYWRRFGREQIDREILRVERCLASNDISLIDRLFWQGRRRELRVAAWLIDRTLTPVATEDRSLVWAPNNQTLESS